MSSVRSTLARLPVFGTKKPVVMPNVDGIVRGEAASIAELYDRMHRRVRAFARRMLADEDAAEDVVQEVFISLPKAMKNFRGESSVETFVCAVAANVCRRHRRSASRRKHAMLRLAEMPKTTCERDLDEGVRAAQLRKALEAGLQKLSFDHRAAFVLCTVEGRPSSEASDILGVPEGTVRTRVFHARKRLREHMKRQGYP